MQCKGSPSFKNTHTPSHTCCARPRKKQGQKALPTKSRRASRTGTRPASRRSRPSRRSRRSGAPALAAPSRAPRAPLSPTRGGEAHRRRARKKRWPHRVPPGPTAHVRRKKRLKDSLVVAAGFSASLLDRLKISQFGNPRSALLARTCRTCAAEASHGMGAVTTAVWLVAWAASVPRAWGFTYAVPRPPKLKLS